MPLLIVIGLVAFAVFSRRSPRFSAAGGRRAGLPGAVVAALILLGLSVVLAQPWLVNVAAIVAVVWLIRALLGAEQTGTHGRERGERRWRKHERRKYKAMRKLARRIHGEWPQVRGELEQASRAFQAELQSFLREVEQYGRGERELLAVPVGAPETPQPPAPRAAPNAPEDEASASIARLLSGAGKRLPPEAQASIRTLRERVQETSAYLAAHDLQHSEFAYLVRQTALDYLPGAVDAYLRLPASLADSAPLDGDKTGKDLLLEQLSMLRGAVEGVLENVARAEGSHLLAHKRFLEDKLEVHGKDFEV